MSHLKKQFEEISKTSWSKGGIIPVFKLPKVKSHKLGISDNGLPIFFIKCEEEQNVSKLVDANLDLIKIEYNRKCELSSNSNTFQGTYTIISLKSDSLEIQQYFLDIVYLMLLNLPEKFSMKELRTEILKLSSLFNKLVAPPLKTIQGLWAELLVIDQSRDPEYLISSWHVTPNDKFDFNDGIDKIEVKSTTKAKRIHVFSSEQLLPNLNSELIIASVLVVQSGMGKNISDLIDSIESKIKSNSVAFLLKEKIAICIGNDFERAQDIYFDYSFSIDNLAFYKIIDIPKIEKIPKEVSSVKFDSDLSNIDPLNKKGIKSRLHRNAINF